MSNLTESLQLGAPTTIFGPATLTATYQFGPSTSAALLDLKSWDSVVISVRVTTAQAATTCNFKVQWSLDGTNWLDEMTETAGASAYPDQPYVPYSRRIDIDMSSANIGYLTREHRLARYMRVAVKSSGVTTGQIQVDIIKLQNYN